uniref:NADH dehydrogenase subunit 6 n=1 Tax=Struthiolaria papulosa TaxID=2821810 RepID=A0A8A6KH28_9CAEN|nr:NADH dehydrogenase subunit 6 [Struthiolaria papulosa]QTI82420.1 NADH dehydrogenase subunit 6 [Struthiolaria papulosa]
MTSIILMSFTICSSLLLPMMAQPLSLGLVIMMLTLLMCCLSAMLLSSWYGYILFLIYVGGLLVMFAYVAALSPNMLFTGSYPMLLMFLLFIPFYDMIYFSYFVDSSSLEYFSTFSSSMYLKMYGSEMASPMMISILIGLGLILLVNLVVVVKICYYQHATLRPFKSIK